MFHTQINGNVVVFLEKRTFKAHIDFRGSVPLNICLITFGWKLHQICEHLDNNFYAIIVINFIFSGVCTFVRPLSGTMATFASSSLRHHYLVEKKKKKIRGNGLFKGNFLAVMKNIFVTSDTLGLMSVEQIRLITYQDTK